MTILTPTSKPVSSASLPDIPQGAAPAGLPDVATLSRLATAFFSAVPGSATPALASLGSGESLSAGLPLAAPALASASNPAPPGSPFAGPGGAGTGVPGLSLPQGKAAGANLLPSAPTHVLSLGNRVPALAPHAVSQNNAPDSVASAAPALEPRFGGAALGVGVPDVAQRDQPAASPFYFLRDAGASSGAGRELPLPSHDVPTAEPLGLPSIDELRSFGSVSGLERAVSAGGEPDRTGSFYFLDNARAPYSNEHLPRAGSAHPPFDVNAIRRDFPILQERVNGRQLVWFDNAATTQKPQSVIDRLSYFYAHENSNIHRAAHALAGRATDAYEGARDTVRRFIGAASPEEIIFVRGTTEGINLIAKTWGVQNVGEGDEIIVSHLEHHANIVPWQQLAAQKGATLRVIPVDDSGQVRLDEYQKLLNSRTKIVSVTQVSNALGTVVPVQEIVAMAHRAGARALVDGAQSVSHMRVNVQEIDADFFVFSGHKLFGPTGIGVVYGKRDLLEDMPPWQGGGNMIADVTFERTVFQAPPNRFEAGTGNIADAVGLGAAIDYVTRVGIENIGRYEHDLLAYATSVLQPVPGVRLIGTAKDKASVLSFVLKGYETEEVGQALNEEGIAVRSGHHCAQPILRHFGVEATVRPSLAFYNTCDEVDRLVSVVRRLSSRR
ncbi:SufS family cysteine desulfurase [Caballeronia sp. SEWSISQ10-4 2]|uniref:family 2A encapsulin nanocompartment cargo protein cysteine desulfurase n=1 Tax=Caballeronia sp. SEWSISQ10-4 2 TaxID=2937438 RepID=UPI00264C7BAB|nr:family 2A encapsulin nanocompartment cargo protein cysteine desulfurase [Caballeronia sp. SEWSISQ10-4 2]MDN7182575.1 SufS family cysteine desulfurase [Caballeronia sp. SEWSISQ10-4 2]